jgi:hypothetical protein
MKKILIFNIFLLVCSFSALAQNTCLVFGITPVSATQVDISVAIRLTSGSTFKLGTSTVTFSFNTAAISNPVLQSNSLSSAYQTITFSDNGGSVALTADLISPVSTANIGTSTGSSVTSGGLGLAIIRFTKVSGTVPVNLASGLNDVYQDDNLTFVSQGSCTTVTSTLPLDLLDFQVNTKDKSSQLSWQTASEVNTQGFDIERSVEGKTFEKVGYVKSSGTSKGTYNFTDEVPLSGVNYYRLKMMNTDGSFTYSPVRSVVLAEGKTTNVSVVPNPAKEQVYVKLNVKEAKTITLVLVDITGKTLMSERKTLGSGFNELSLSLNNYPQGLYFLKIVDANTTETHRLVIAK